MADNFDPCECIFNHESTMQRLLSMLRQSQTHCNDVFCQNDLSSPLADQSGSVLSTPFFMVFAWFVAAAGMYAYRAFRHSNSSGKPGPSGSDNNEPPALY